MRSLKQIFCMLLAFSILLINAQLPAKAVSIDAGNGWRCSRYSIDYVGYTSYGPWQCDFVGTSMQYYYGSDPAGSYYISSHQECREIRQRRPANCPDPIDVPTSGEYGYAQGVFESGSGLAKLIALSNSGQTMPGISDQIRTALTNHTGALSTLSFSATSANQSLIDELKPICEEQAGLALTGAYGTSKCFDSLYRLARENGDQSVLNTLQNWITVNHFDMGIGPFSVATLVGAFESDNSLTAKFNLVTANAQCSYWWRDAYDTGCVIQ